MWTLNTSCDLENRCKVHSKRWCVCISVKTLLASERKQNITQNKARIALWYFESTVSVENKCIWRRMTLKSCKILFTYCTKLVQLISFHRHTICTSTSTPTIADTLISANQPRELLLSIQLVRCLYSPNNSLLSHCSIIAITLSDLAGSIY